MNMGGGDGWRQIGVSQGGVYWFAFLQFQKKVLAVLIRCCVCFFAMSKKVFAGVAVLLF